MNKDEMIGMLKAAVVMFALGALFIATYAGLDFIDYGEIPTEFWKDALPSAAAFVGGYWAGRA